MVKYISLENHSYYHNNSRRNIAIWNCFSIVPEIDCQKFIILPPEFVKKRLIGRGMLPEKYFDTWYYILVLQSNQM